MDPRLLILLVCCCIGRVEPQTCSRPVGETSSCVCETNSGIVDLTALGNPDGEKEKYECTKYLFTFLLCMFQTVSLQYCQYCQYTLLCKSVGVAVSQQLARS